MGEKRGEKSYCDRCHFPAQKVRFCQARAFFQDFFSPGGGLCPNMDVDGQQWVAIAACCTQSNCTSLEALMLLFMATLLQ